MQFFAGRLTTCQVHADGTLGLCVNSTVSSAVGHGIDVAVNGTDLYFAADTRMDGRDLLAYNITIRKKSGIRDGICDSDE